MEKVMVDTVGPVTHEHKVGQAARFVLSGNANSICRWGSVLRNWRNTYVQLLIAVLVFIIFPVPAFCAAEEKTEHLFGDVHVFGPDGTEYSVDTILVEKVTSPKDNKVTERYLKLGHDGKIIDSTVTMNVEGNKMHWIASDNSFTGDGELFGKPWNWTYFKASLKFTNGMKAEIENFLGDPEVLGARKKIYAADGNLQVVTEESLHNISASSFSNLISALKKAQPN